MITIGLTGGIASGKSAAAQVLAGLGARVWDADAASRKAVRPGEAGNRALREAFGETFFSRDGELNRRRLAEYVFGNPERVLELNRTLHPHILADMRRQLDRWRREGAAVAVVDAPLLFEAGIDRYVDEVWVVSCGEDEQLRRLRLRNGYSEEEAMARIEAQLPDAERRMRARHVIDTSGPAEDTARFIEALYAELLEENRCEES